MERSPPFFKKERALFALTDYIISASSTLSLEEVVSQMEPHFSNDEIKILIGAIKQIDLWTRSMKYHKVSSNPEKG
ncbi:MAG: hypothetical protein JKY22_03330 [Flavobacteriaceae bacterium]|nr:hypothetical protein [Flavobacteriaceae bacterium]